jgi:hypothetical protein
MMKKLAFATLVAMGVTTAAIGQEQPSPRGGDRTVQVGFETADKNADGRVNREEAGMIAGFDFSRADTNNDASLSRSEYQAAMATSTPRGDGVPGPRSGDRTAQVSFDTADKDKDGKVSRGEADDIPALGNAH